MPQQALRGLRYYLCKPLQSFRRPQKAPEGVEKPLRPLRPYSAIVDLLPREAFESCKGLHG